MFPGSATKHTEDEKKTQECHNTYIGETHCLSYRGVCTGQGQHHRDITEEIVHLIGATVGQLKDEEREDRCMQTAPHPGA